MAADSTEGNFFEDFEVGQIIHHLGGRTISEGDAATYLALTGDRYPNYCDRTFAQAQGYRQELINDLLVFHVVFGKTVSDISLNAVANLGYADVRFLQPVYPGDTLHAVSEIVGLKENSSGKNGNVYVQTTGRNQNDQIVLQFYRWVMVRKKNSGDTTGIQVVPELPKEVNPSAFVVGPEVEVNCLEASKNGPWFFDDYEIGSRIHHRAGTTLTETEHAMATRLYQNTAKVHFDAQAMRDTPAGKRLVYGGHVISVARAQAYNGFETILRMLAWNAGTHANPVYAGDTLYSFTDVLDKQPVPGRDDLGALRLRLLAVKNHDPESEPLEIKRFDDTKKRDVYHSNLVLDLDYWALIAKPA